ncbi:MAG: hypothetical protein M1115_04885 [Actinobacteria bacterium]|nr:hypothetical protein [Actinomycetota bacterium]
MRSAADLTVLAAPMELAWITQCLKEMGLCVDDPKRIKANIACGVGQSRLERPPLGER